MNIARIEAILADSFGAVGKNQVPLPGTEVVDIFIMRVPLSTEKVYQYAAEMVELLKDWPDETWGPLGGEVNYLVAGGALGDRRVALMLFAFGKLLDWWDVLDPSTMLGLEVDNPLALQMAHLGMVAIFGYRPQVAA